MGLHTMAVTLVLFFAVPRFEQVAWRNPIAQQQVQPLVGFTDKVTLGELGTIIESRESVMRAQFFQGKDDTTPLQLNSEVYLQGAYLMSYKHGQWEGQVASAETLGTSPLVRERWLPWSKVVRQKFKIEGLDRPELFYVAPYLPIDEAYLGIDIDHASQRLLRSDDRRSREFTYTLATTAIVEGRQLSLTPVAWYDLVDATTEYPKDDLSRLVDLAKKWIKDSNPPDTNYGRACCLRDKLASGQFQYSLTGVERNPNIDPIEDFLTEHQQGHCEYFATALTLMLRSQNIPARMVSGFKCESDAWNSAGGYYQVRQWHAHTWVEAYLPSSQLPDGEKHAEGYWSRGQRSWRRGGWLRLDPTPAGEGGEHATWFTPVRDGFDWLEGAWSRYVVELDCKTQRDAIYQPIVDVVRGLWQMMLNFSVWDAFGTVSVALYLDHLNREVKWSLLGLIAVLYIAIAVGIGWLLFRIGRWLRARWTGNRSRRPERRRAKIAFYRRFEHLMARHGLVRAPAQTQREFAAAAGVHFASLTGDSRLATLPAMVADAFYRVRFGQAPLDNRQTQAVEQALLEIAAIRKNVPVHGPIEHQSS
jgi:transglutaminase-like putative cysteine protease